MGESTTIFLDESGYTGDDLCDSKQPTFVIATHSYSEEEATALRAQFFTKVAAGELKHSTLRKRHQPDVLKLLEYITEQPDRVRVVFAHKRFALTGKVVDLIIEPATHRDGLNLYEDGANVAIANTLFVALGVEGSPVLDRLLRLFQRLVRERTDDAASDLFRFLDQAQPVGVVDEALDLVRAGARRLERADIVGLPARSLDLSFSAALACVYAWRKAGVTPIRLVHDASTNMAKQAALWDAILAPTAPPALVGHGDFNVQFPIGVESTIFKDSRESDALQIADVIAGAIGYSTRWVARGRSATDAYGTALDHILRERINSLVPWCLWPSNEIERRPAAPAGVVDGIVYLSERAGAAEE